MDVIIRTCSVLGCSHDGSHAKTSLPGAPSMLELFNDDDDSKLKVTVKDPEDDGGMDISSLNLTITCYTDAEQDGIVRSELIPVQGNIEHEITVNATANNDNVCSVWVQRGDIED